MRPTIVSGELIRIVPISSVARGDVITFVLDDAVVTHRVMAVTAAEIVCRGDNRQLADRPCRARPSSAGRGGRRPRAAGRGAAGAGAGGRAPRAWPEPA